MEFHPSHARAVERASGAASNQPPASFVGLAVPQALGAAGSIGGSPVPPALHRAPRLIDLERRVKFARPDSVFA